MILKRDAYFNTGFSLLAFLFIILVLKTFFLSIQLNGDSFILAFAMLAGLAINFKNYKSALLFMVSLLIAFWVSGSILDLSYDGNWYHKEAILQIASGWSPFHSPALALSIEKDPSNWINYYCKSTWFIGAVFYKTFGKIEVAKATHLILIFSVFFSSLSLFQKILPKLKKTNFLLATLLTFNPVSAYQFLCLYVDGQISSLFILCCIFLINFFNAGQSLSLIALAMAVIIISTTKATGAVFSLSLLIMALIVFFYIRKLYFKKLLYTFLFCCALIPALGYNPYITNFVRYGSPIYPLDNYGIMGVTPPQAMLYPFIPQEFIGKNRFEKLALDLFSVSSFESFKLKMPFTMKSGEATSFAVFDLKHGGFGPLFSASLIVGLALLIYAWKISKNPRRILFWSLPILIVLTTSLTNPEAWWARYSPQTFLISFLVLLIGCAQIRETKSSFLKVLLVVQFLLLIINGEIILENSLRRQLGVSNEMTKTLESYRAKPIRVHLAFHSLKSRLDEFKLVYTLVNANEAKTLKPEICLIDQICIFSAKNQK